jgi:hypothetical protein
MKRKAAFLLSVVLLALFSLGTSPVPPEHDSRMIELSNIYIADTLMVLSDPQTGIHVYSIADKNDPVFLRKIPLQGNTGTAVRGDIIYANCWDGLLALRLGEGTGWDTAAVLREVSPHFLQNDVAIDGVDRHPFFGCSGPAPVAYDASSPVNSGGSGGSYAIFAPIDTFLYYADHSEIVTMSIAVPDTPRVLSRTYVDWSIETLFPTEEHLFVGGTSGMYVLDLVDPAHPKLIGGLAHFQACDPVVVIDTVAWVTLRGGNGCGETRDVLLSVSIADPSNPKLLSETYTPTPYGLAAQDSLLIVSNGFSGSRIYRISDPYVPEGLQSWSGPETKDFIWLGNDLFVMAFDEVRIYDMSTPLEPVLLSSIGVR